jgi:ATP-dependent DNA helicase RecG
VLVSPPRLAEAGRARIEALVASADGFEIAERDLELRGPGDFFGTRQSGLPSLRVGDLMRDRKLMEQARADAERWLRDESAESALVPYLTANWASRFGLVGIG